MAIEAYFPIPLYTEVSVDDEYIKIQKELLDVYKELNFCQVQNFSPDTHEINEGNFSRNILKEYKCTNFISFLDKSIDNYLQHVNKFTSGILPYEFKYMITTSWITRTRKGKYAHAHHHRGSDISGVYYIQTNGMDGHLRIEHPLNAFGKSHILWMISGVDPRLELEQGRIHLFPSFLRHRTETNPVDHDRLSLSFNIKILSSSFSPR
tara:strand:+ start:107 stop:730 length:624 start_codon:yes stop_codon:yes gene_type:complete